MIVFAYNPIDKSLTITGHDSLPRGGALQARVLGIQGRASLMGVSFGADLIGPGGQVVKSIKVPPEGIKIVCTDTPSIYRDSFEWLPETEYALHAWCVNTQGELVESQVSFISPADPVIEPPLSDE